MGSIRSTPSTDPSQSTGWAVRRLDLSSIDRPDDTSDRAAPPIRRELVIAAAIAAAGSVLVAATWIYASVGGQSFGEMSRDPNTLSETPPTNGMLSLLGIGLWGVAVGGAGLAAMTVRRADAHSRRAWMGWAALSALLLVDDALQLHETFLPNRGVPEWATFLLYGLAAGLAAVALARELRSFATAATLAAAIVVLGASFAVDIVLVDRPNFLVEDGLKFVGIGLWAFGTLRAAQLRFPTRDATDRSLRSSSR